MGWSFNMSRSFGRKELIAKIDSPEFWVKGVEIIATAVRGNSVWQVIDAPAGEIGSAVRKRFIYLTLIKSGGRDSGWGYKSMSESCGPAYYDCPLSFLALAPVADGEYAAAWRQRVREAHAARTVQRSAASAMKVGDAVMVYGKPYRLIQKLKRGWVVVDAGGLYYRATRGIRAVAPQEPGIPEVAKQETSLFFFMQRPQPQA